MKLLLQSVLLTALWLAPGCSLREQLQNPDWLLGTWIQQTARGAVYETWQRNEDLTFSARSYRLNGQDTLLLETVTLQRENNLWIYIPTVSKQNEGRAIRFQMESQDDSSLVFTNPAHDFPQKITYYAIGSDSLVAVISGLREGKIQARTFKMERLAD